MNLRIAIFACLLSLCIDGQAGMADAPGLDRNGTSRSKQRIAFPDTTSGSDLIARAREFELMGKKDVANEYYRQAMLAGNPEGAFHVGCLGNELADASQGRIKLLKQRAALDGFYCAATNHHAGACLKIAAAFQEGKGISQSLTQAYLWLKLARDFDPGIPMQKLDEVAIQLDTSELQWAQIQARQYLDGGWPPTIGPALQAGDPRLRINGVSTGATTTVMINGVTFQQGDSASVVPLQTKTVGVKIEVQSLQVVCMAIGEDYVLVKVANETDIRLLALDI